VLRRSKTPSGDSSLRRVGGGRRMKGVELYGRVRHAVQIDGLSHREAARRFGIVPGHGYETARCAGHAAILNPVAASVSRAFCSALI